MKEHPVNLEAYEKEKSRYEDLAVWSFMGIVLTVLFSLFFFILAARSDNPVIAFIFFVGSSSSAVAFIFCCIVYFSNKASFDCYSPLTLKDFPKEWKLIHFIAKKDPQVDEWLMQWRVSEVGLIYGDISLVEKYIDEQYEKDKHHLKTSNDETAGSPL